MKYLVGMIIGFLFSIFAYLYVQDAKYKVNQSLQWKAYSWAKSHGHNPYYVICEDINSAGYGKCQLRIYRESIYIECPNEDKSCIE